MTDHQLKIIFSYIFILLLSASLFAQQAKKFELADIEFKGNDAISEFDLNQVILSKTSPGWLMQLLNKVSSFGGKAVYFDSLLIPTDITAIKNLYQSRGYFKSRVKARYSIDAASEKVKLTFEINQFQPALIKSFTAKGLNQIDPDFFLLLSRYIKTDSTTIYKDALVEEKNNFIVNFLHDHGFMLVKADRPTIVVDTLKNSVDISLGFNTGIRYKIGEIRTSRTGKGADLVEDDLLRDIIGIKTGTWYSFYDIQVGTTRLYRTDLFQSSTINAVISDTVKNVVPLNISADIGQMHELSPELIANNEDNTFNLGLGMNFIKKNFLGEARKFTVGVSVLAQNLSEFIRHPSFADSSFYGLADTRISIEQPFLFGHAINTKLESYFTFQKRKDEYNSKLYGAKLSFEFELAQYAYFTSLGTYVNLEHAEFDYQPTYLIGLTSTAYQQEGHDIHTSDSLATIYVMNQLHGHIISQSLNAIIGMNLNANKSNDVLFPTSGYTLSMQLEDGNFFPYAFSKIFDLSLRQPAFFKTVITGTIYPHVYDSKLNALGLKFKIGQIFTYHGDKADITLNQRLYAGGSNSVRGWATRELVPSEGELNISNISQEDLEGVLTKVAATGGFFLMEGSIETRNRLIGRIGSALFIDYGNTWNSSHEFHLNGIAVAAGFGLRYYSDMVPFRIDFGFKAYDPNDHRPILHKQFWKELLQIHLGIGEAF